MRFYRELEHSWQGKMRLDDSAEHFTARNELANPNGGAFKPSPGIPYRGPNAAVQVIN